MLTGYEMFFMNDTTAARCTQNNQHQEIFVFILKMRNLRSKTNNNIKAPRGVNEISFLILESHCNNIKRSLAAFFSIAHWLDFIASIYF